jgi:hypothetical protein
MKISKLEHEAFIKDCENMIIYFKYKKHQFKDASSFNELELEKYHRAYVILRSSWGDYNGSVLIGQIQSIIMSNKTTEEKYNDYKKYIDNEIDIYNKANIMKKYKQIEV